MHMCKSQYEESLLKFCSWFDEINVIVNLFFMFALMTPIQSPLILRKLCGGHRAGEKNSFPQSVYNLSLYVYSCKELKARPVEVDTVTKRIKYSGSIEGRERMIPVGLEHKWQIYITQAQGKLSTNLRMLVYCFAIIIMSDRFLDASSIVHELTTGSLSNP